MDRIPHLTTRLWGIMQHWLGWRAGREAAAGDAGKAVDTSKTWRWREALDKVGHDNPRDLAAISLAILAEARGLCFRSLARALREADKDGLAEVPEVDNIIAAIWFWTGEERRELFDAQNVLRV